MQKYGSTNYIEIDGQDVRMDSLGRDERKRIAHVLQEQMMELAGFRRKKQTA